MGSIVSSGVTPAMVKMIIRPARQSDYDEDLLGQPEFDLGGKRVKRTDFTLTNYYGHELV